MIDINSSPAIAMYIIDFNAKNTLRWNRDFTNLQGAELVELTANYSLNHIINGSTHILSNFESCIDSIFTMERNFNTDSGVLPSLFPSCHHQLNFAKVSFTTFFRLAYGQRTLDVSRAMVSAIRQAVNCVDCVGHSTA